MSVQNWILDWKLGLLLISNVGIKMIKEMGSGASGNARKGGKKIQSACERAGN